MILVDANLLLYAYHAKSEQHTASRAWLEKVLSGPELVRFAWLTLWAFLRIGTNPRVFERPLSTAEAEAAISSWLAQAAGGIIEPAERHWDILRGLVREPGRRPARDGCGSRGDRPGAWRDDLHDRSRFLPVFRTQMDDPPCGDWLNRVRRTRPVRLDRGDSDASPLCSADEQALSSGPAG